MKRILQNLNLLRHYDWTLIILVFVLLIFSFASIYSIDLSKGDNLIYFPTQILALSIGAIVLVIASKMHITFYQSISKPLYIVAFFLLLGVLFFGSDIRGTTGWYRVGGLSFQPAEFAKLSLIVAMAALISKRGRRFDKPQFVIASGLLAAIFVFLILMQPDLGSALVIGGIWFGLLVLSGTKKRYIFGLIILVILSFLFAWNYVFKPYQKERIMVFLHPEEDLLEAGYNVNQSIIAIGAGKLHGRGLGFGSQSQLHFLPEAQTDFIFSVIAEELGFVGVFLVLFLYILILLRLIRIARNCRSDFGSNLVLGIVLLFFIQVVFNIGATTGLLPVTGLTLPFMSYGGSSLVINLLLIGIAQSVAKTIWENQEENILYG